HGSSKCDGGVDEWRRLHELAADNGPSAGSDGIAPFIIRDLDHSDDIWKRAGNGTQCIIVETDDFALPIRSCVLLSARNIRHRSVPICDPTHVVDTRVAAVNLESIGLRPNAGVKAPNHRVELGDRDRETIVRKGKREIHPPPTA